MPLDPVTLNQLKKALTKDVALVSRFTAGVSVNVAAFVTIGEEAGPIKGRLVGLVINQNTDTGRIPDEVKITIDGTARTSTGLAGSDEGDVPFPTEGARNNYPIVYPLGDRFKSSWKVELKGNGSAGTFEASIIWAEEV
jgi:hypothetical protein